MSADTRGHALPRVATCVYGDCDASSSERLDVPVCDRHALRIYRAVSSFVASEKTPIPRPLARRRHGLVYFLRLGDRIKIGFTTNLQARLLQVPHEEVLGTYPGTMLDERREHERWAALRTKGEWFHAAPQLLARAAEFEAGR